MNKLAAAFPQSQFTGIDISEAAIATAQATARCSGLTNIQFRVQDAATWYEVAQYDLITTFDAVHDQPKPDVVMGAGGRRVPACPLQ